MISDRNKNPVAVIDINNAHMVGNVALGKLDLYGSCLLYSKTLLVHSMNRFIQYSACFL